MQIHPTLFLSCHRALTGAIPKSLRGLTVSYSERELHWRGYFETEPTDDEKDVLSTACTNVLADFPNIMRVVEEYVYVPYPQPLEMLQGWLFLRWEGA